MVKLKRPLFEKKIPINSKNASFSEKKFKFSLENNFNKNKIENSEWKKGILHMISFWKEDWIHTLKNPSLRDNFFAGMTVVAVALPLNIALAIACQLPPSAGLIAGAVGGVIAALFGGSRYQATGPAAALNIMVFQLVSQFGVAGAFIAAIIVGVLEILMSLMQAGRFVAFMPEAVLIGFTSGVGVKLLDAQLPKLFGVQWALSDMILQLHQPAWLNEASWPAVTCGFFVILTIMAFKVFPKFPAALVGISLVTLVANYLSWPIPRVGQIPPVNLSLALPSFDSALWLAILPLAIPLGVLAAIESLLSAQAVDRMTGGKHESNLELWGQGLANIAAGVFGGMPVSGVIVRSSANVQSGAKNRISSLLHAIFLFIVTVFIASWIEAIPLAALAGLLSFIGFRLIEFGSFIHFLKNSKLETIMFLSAFIGTVKDHLLSGLIVGVLIYAIDYIWHREAREKNAQQTEKQSQGIRASILVQKKNFSIQDHVALSKESTPPLYQVLERGERWLQHLKQMAHIPSSAHVHANATIIGHVRMGRDVHVAAEASIRADEGTPFYIGDYSNIQDGVVIHALKNKWVHVNEEPWAVFIGQHVSVAHQALIHGPSYVGDHCFIGFRAVIHDSTLGAGCYVGIGAVVVGVEIPAGKYIPHGALIDAPDKVSGLQPVTEQHRHFNEDVVEVNRGLAQAYNEIYQQTRNLNYANNNQ